MVVAKLKPLSVSAKKLWKSKMKKVLFGSTILTATVALSLSTSSIQAQEKAKPLQISVGGFFNSVIGFADQSDSFENDTGTPGLEPGYDSFNIYNDSEIHFTGSTKLDNGIGVEVHVELEADQVSAGVVDDSFMRLTGSFGDIRFGSTDAVTSVFANTAPAVGATGPNDGDVGNFIVKPSAVSATADTLLGTGNIMKVTYLTPTFNGFQAGFSFEPSDSDTNAMPVTKGDSGTDTTEYNVGLSYSGKMGTTTVAADISYKEDVGTDANSITGIRGGISLGIGAFTIGGSFKDIDHAGTGIEGTSSSLEETGYDIGAQYDFGNTSVSATYLHSSMPLASGTTGDDEVQSLFLGASHNISPGVDLLGNVTWAEWKDEATTDASNNQGFAVIGGVGITF